MKQEKSESSTGLSPEPHHQTLALDILMRWTNVSRIETREDLHEFLFRVAFLMDLNTIGSKTDTGNFLAMYGFRDSQYHFTTDILAKYIGYRSEDSTESFLPRESFLKGTFISGFNAMMKGGQYGIEISVPKHLVSDEGGKKVVTSQVETPENVAGAEKEAARLMEKISADAFSGKNIEFVRREMALQPYEDHLPQVQLPRPGRAEYQMREDYRNMIKAGAGPADIHHRLDDLLSSFDWSHELTKEGELYGLKNALGEVLLPPLFENFTMMTKQELKIGDRVVTQLGGKWGVIIADGKGTWLIKPEYDYIGYPNDVTHVCKDGKWGVMDISKGEYLVRPECEEIPAWNGFMFMNRIGFYKKDGKWGVITDWGVLTAPIFEDYGGDTDDGQVEVQYQGQWGYINEKNEFTNDEDDAYYHYQLD